MNEPALIRFSFCKVGQQEPADRVGAAVFLAGSLARNLTFSAQPVGKGQSGTRSIASSSCSGKRFVRVVAASGSD
jgi:hypothetical protein